MQPEQVPEQQFMNIVQSHLKYLKAGEQLQAQQQLKALGLDSMAAIDLLLDIEDTYNVVLPDTYLTEEHFSTAQALWAVITDLRSRVESAS